MEQQHLTPALHDLAVSVAAPAVLIADPDGQVGSGGVSGWYVDDTRLFSELAVSVAGSDLELVRSGVTTDEQSMTYVARRLGGWLHDPLVTLTVRRSLSADRLRQELTLSHRGPEPFDLELRLAVVCDLADMATVRMGEDPPALTPDDSVDTRSWSNGARGLTARFEPVPRFDDDRSVVWAVHVEPGDRLEFVIEAQPGWSPAFGHGGPGRWGDLPRETTDHRLSRLVSQSLADLDGLLLRDGEDPFAAAGSPWFLTLFGRDALWVARLMMPFSTDLAMSTLRVLARRQGSRHDPESEEQPGKILHEVRNTALELGEMRLPPVYYGSIDATPLFVCTLADAWRSGAPGDQVAGLLPAVRRCLQWLLDQSRESGWLRYVDSTGRGLANQGWKDSVDSVQFADGRLAGPPIALCEVQGYAYEAATRGAELLADFGVEPVEGLEQWAADLRRRFGEAFWVPTAEGGHVAIALDGEGAPVDSVTSNMAHLLGTGILEPGQLDRVVALLGSPELDSGFGLRTLSAASPRFAPLSYHGGSVWPHDTAIAIRGLAIEGRHEELGRLVEGLLVAAEARDYRLPELYGGESSETVSQPSAYPAACRPQAWAAAAGPACLAALRGSWG